MADGTPPRTREDLERLIAGAIRRGITYLSEREALATADRILRDFRAAGLRITAPRPNPSDRS